MNPEQSPDEIITMPSELRIMQRLGQVSTNASLRAHLFPDIARNERKTYTPEGFVLMLADQMTHYSEEHVLGITALTLTDMPSYINALLDSDEHKLRALESWEKLEEAARIDAKEREEIRKRYLTKESRRDKKKNRSTNETSRRSIKRRRKPRR